MKMMNALAEYPRSLWIVWIILGVFYLIIALAMFTIFIDRINYPRVKHYVAGFFVGLFWLPLLILAWLFDRLVIRRIERRREKIDWSDFPRPHGEVNMNGYTEETALQVMQSAKGWHPLIKRAFKLIEGTEITVAQVKEKFGSLRIYTNPTADPKNAEVMEGLWQIEIESTHTCMVCGKPGEIRDLPWILTLCEVHYNEFKKKHGIK